MKYLCWHSACTQCSLACQDSQVHHRLQHHTRDLPSAVSLRFHVVCWPSVMLKVPFLQDYVLPSKCQTIPWPFLLSVTQLFVAYFKPIWQGTATAVTSSFLNTEWKEEFLLSSFPLPRKAPLPLPRKSHCLVCTARHRHRGGIWQQVDIRSHLYPLERETSFVGIFFMGVYFPCKFTCITRIESSCQIFAHAFNLKELMSPLCHLCCSTQQAKKLITWITRVWRTHRRWQSSFPFWAATKLYCCALQVCLGLYLTQEAPTPISAVAQLQQKGIRPNEALLLPADESTALVCFDP